MGAALVAMTIACGTSRGELRLTDVDPDTIGRAGGGWIEVRGDNLEPWIRGDLAHPERAHIARYRARLAFADGEHSLADVELVGSGRLRGHAPPGLPLGRYAVEIVDPGGRVARLDDAVEVVAGACAAPGGVDDDCDGVDDDCDGPVDEDYAVDDACGVGLCRALNTPSACVAGVESPCTPAAPVAEVADDGLDQDCNGADTVTCVVDADGDGFGTELGTSTLAADGSCDAADGESSEATDCDDGPAGCGAACFPGATESIAAGNCDDGYDNDCSGGVDADDFGCALHVDDFDDDDADDFEWSGSQWQVTGGQVEQTVACDTPSDAMLDVPDWVDYTVAADVRGNASCGSGSWFQAGLIARVQSIGACADMRYYACVIDFVNDFVAVGKYDGTCSTTAASLTPVPGLAFGQWYHLELTVSGDAVGCAVSGGNLPDTYRTSWVDDGTPYPAGKVGFRTYDAAASFDNLWVRPL